MPLDPKFRAVLDDLEAGGGFRAAEAASAQELRESYRLLSTAQRGADYVPEQVAKVEDRIVDSESGGIPIRVYSPVNDRGRVVTYTHGGGWVIGDLDTHDPIARRVANGLGATVVSVEYRLAPEHPFPAPQEDCHSALSCALPSA